MPKIAKPIPFAAVESRIHLIRGSKVMLDGDLAQLYGVATKNLNKAVARNLNRFPEGFMYQITGQELTILRFQSGTSSLHGGRRHMPYAFTQEGIAMLSSVLRSPPQSRSTLKLCAPSFVCAECWFPWRNWRANLKRWNEKPWLTIKI